MFIKRSTYEAMQSDLEFHQRENASLRKYIEELKTDCAEQLTAYNAFKAEYDAYRAAFDPVSPTPPPEFEQRGNVVFITRHGKG